MLTIFAIYREELVKEQYTAMRISNVDETGIYCCSQTWKDFGQAWSKAGGKITSGEKGVTTTVNCAINAAGEYLPPMLIFRRKRMTHILLRGAPPGTVGGCSENGW